MNRYQVTLPDGAVVTRNSKSKSPHMSIQEAADYWAVSKDWIEKQITQGHLTAKRAGRLIRLERTEVENLLKKVPS